MQKKIKIAIVISHPIQHFCPQYVSFTKNDQVECRVFFASALGYKKYVDLNFGKEISWGNLNLDKFDHVFLNNGEVLQATPSLDAPALENELSSYGPRLLFTYGYFQKLQRRACRWAIHNKIPVAYISDSELRHKRNALKEMIKSVFLRSYFSRITYFLTMGNANEAFYEKYGVKQNRMIRMHYPIDRQFYENSYANKPVLRKTKRQQYQLNEDDIALVVVGKLVTWKNQDHIIAAMQLLEQEGIYLHLWILGSGAMQAEWEEKGRQLKHSKVYFAGFVPIEELPAYYAAADIYVHPASLEPHSVAISEAIMMGTPIILSDRCGSYGATDDVQEGWNGLVYPFGDIPALAEKITLLAKDVEKRNAFALYSHKIATDFQQVSHYGMMETLSDKLKAVQLNKK
ncbi:glycosyltransferase family 4 protein [soil metagenome]